VLASTNQKRTTKNNSSRKSSTGNSTKKSTKAVAKNGTARSSQTRKKARTHSEKRASSEKSYRYKKEHYDKAMIQEAVLLTVSALAIVLLLSNFGLCGKFGKTVSSLMFGLFGITAYVFPVLFFLGVLFLVSNLKKGKAKIKLASAIIVYLAVCAIVQQMSFPYEKETTLSQCYSYSSKLHQGGGWFGSLFSYALVPVIGSLGMYILMAALILAGIVLITEKSFIGGVKKHGSRVVHSAAEDAAHFVQENRVRHEEKLQQQTKVRKKRKKTSPAAIFTLEEESSSTPIIEAQNSFPYGGAQGYTEAMAASYKEESREKDRGYSQNGTNYYGSNGYNGYENPNLDGHGNWEENRIEELQAYYQEREGQQELHEITAEEEDRFVSAKKEDVLLNPLESSAKAQEEQEILDMTVYQNVEVDMLTESGIPPEMLPFAVGEKEEATTYPLFEQKTSEWICEEKEEYHFPPITLLTKGKEEESSERQLEENQEVSEKLETTLRNFGVGIKVTDVISGPTVTRYELLPDQGVKVSRIVALADDIKLSLAAADIRIEAPIPGKSAVGIEVPNKENATVMLRDLLEEDCFKEHKSCLAFAVGKDIGGQTIVTDIGKMPHALIAGATGSGKSVCINTLIMSILYKAHPDEVKLIMIDPKVVELSVYNGIPHLLIPVVTDPKKAAGALNWAVLEMQDRYRKFSEWNVRNIQGYNEKIELSKVTESEEKKKELQKMPKIIIIIDELADLMMVASSEVEESICRLAQLARAAGIHLIIATQRPSVNVITGLIKANIPSRIAFAVSSGVDSRTILDTIGAEKLLGKGDMLFSPYGSSNPIRVQGAFVSDQEVSAVVDFLKSQKGVVVQNAEAAQNMMSAISAEADSEQKDKDDYFVEAGRFILKSEKASIGMLQRKFKIGFNRAARIMNQLSEAGVVGPEEGTKPRKILMTQEEFEKLIIG